MMLFFVTHSNVGTRKPSYATDGAETVNQFIERIGRTEKDQGAEILEPCSLQLQIGVGPGFLVKESQT